MIDVKTNFDCNLTQPLVFESVANFTRHHLVYKYKHRVSGTRPPLSLNDPPSRPLIGPDPAIPGPLIGRPGSRDLNTSL